MPSSVIRDFSYDPAAERLDVLFVSGRLYSYHGVPERLAERMRQATSKGSFFNRRIRNHFRFTGPTLPKGSGRLTNSASSTHTRR